MQEQVDWKVRTDSMKVLTIIFILAIIAVNSLLIFKFIRHGRILWSQRRAIILTLALGEILVALFPLVVNAQVLFEQDLNCRNNVMARVYQSWFLPFVYGVALVILCGELIKRQWIRSTFSYSGMCVSLLLAAIPWISALVVILPLAIAGFTYWPWSNRCFWDTAFTESQMRACYVIGAILPSCVAVITATWTASRTVLPESEVAQVPMIKNSQVLNSTGTPQQNQSVVTLPSASQVCPTSHSAYPVVNPTHPVASQTSPVTNPTYPVANPTYPAANSSYLVTQPTCPSAPQTSFSAASYSADPDQTKSEAYLAAAVRQEQQTLVVVAIANAILTLPFSFFCMCYLYRLTDIDRMDPVPDAVITDITFWLMYLRSVVVPLIWLCKSRVPV